jgi:TRAP-type uncharacterized transport system substrate-binding protein
MNMVLGWLVGGLTAASHEGAARYYRERGWLK